MKKLRWQLLVVVLALVAIGVLLLGQKPAVAPGETEAVQPVSGGVYTEALVGSLGRLNPLLDAYNQPDRDINRVIFSSLIQFDDRGVPQPDLDPQFARLPVPADEEVLDADFPEQAADAVSLR